MSSIIYLDGKKVRGYQVRWGKQGKGETKLFSTCLADKKWAWLAAVEFKQELDKRLNAPKRKRPKNNTSGITGISIRTRQEERREASDYVHINYKDALGHHRHSACSIERHGIEMALNKAIRLRSINGDEVPSLVECLAVLVFRYMQWEFA